jgi:hypothetical protein
MHTEEEGKIQMHYPTKEVKNWGAASNKVVQQPITV